MLHECAQLPDDIYLWSDLYSLLSKLGPTLHMRSWCYVEKHSANGNPSFVPPSREFNVQSYFYDKSMTSKRTVGYLFWGNKEALLWKVMEKVCWLHYYPHVKSLKKDFWPDICECEPHMNHSWNVFGCIWAGCRVKTEDGTRIVWGGGVWWQRLRAVKNTLSAAPEVTRS